MIWGEGGREGLRWNQDNADRDVERRPECLKCVSEGEISRSLSLS